jgi:hypothetical protein
LNNKFGKQITKIQRNNAKKYLNNNKNSCNLLIHKIIKNIKFNKNNDKKKNKNNAKKTQKKEMKNSYLNGVLYFGS